MYLLKLLTGAGRGIVSCRNSGLGDNLIAAASAWWYARQTGRTLSICWFHSRYLPDARDNAFCHFFEVPEQIQGVPVHAKPRVDRFSSFVLMHWAYLVPFPDLPGMFERRFHRTALARFISSRFTAPARGRGFAWSRRQEKETRLVENAADTPQRLQIASGCHSPMAAHKAFFDSLRLKPHLSHQLEEFAVRHFQGKVVIGVHIRYYDPSLPDCRHSDFWADSKHRLSLCRQQIEDAVRAAGTPDYVVFLSTDSRRVHEFIGANVSHVVSWEKPWGSDQGRELHEEVPVETAEATVMEMFLLARSHLLVRLPTHSWFSHYASLYVPPITA